MVWIWIRRVLGGFLLLLNVARMAAPSDARDEPTNIVETLTHVSLNVLTIALGVWLLVSAQRAANRRRRAAIEAQTAGQRMAAGYPVQGPYPTHPAQAPYPTQAPHPGQAPDPAPWWPRPTAGQGAGWAHGQAPGDGVQPGGAQQTADGHTGDRHQ